LKLEGLKKDVDGPIRKSSIVQSSIPIALLGPAPPDRGGIAHETAHLAAELGRLCPVRYFTFSRPYPAWLDPRRFSHDPGLTPAPAEPVLDYLSPLSWLRAADRVAEVQAGALIVPWWTSFWGLPVRAVFRRLSRRRGDLLRVLLCHNLEDHETGVVQRFLTGGALDAADAFVVHSEEDRAALARRFPRRPAAAIPLPALAPSATREQARRRLGIEGRLVLFLGLVRRYKGVATLLEAAPRIAAESGARIAVVGEVFPDARDLERVARENPAASSILWLDRYVTEEEMDLWLAACDVAVLPYTEISGSAIAARAIGALRPIAASAVGGLKEVVVPGSTGELFAAGDAAGLARAVARILERGLAHYEPGLERAAEEMAWPRYAARIFDFIESIRREP
jgi:glycosyltransferase involved in cell wall biosynthesis